MADSFDVCIRGSGVVGSTLALLLARQRLRVALVGPTSTDNDVRAYALNAHSRACLTDLRCWPDESLATAVQSMQVHGDAGGEVTFAAPSFQGLTHIVDVQALDSRLREAIAFQPSIQRCEEPVEATLTVICEGRYSPTREAMNIVYDKIPYEQHALATRVSSEKPHHQQACQWFSQNHGELDILAMLPMGGATGSSWAVVWSLPSARAASLKQADPHTLAETLTQATRSQWGALTVHTAAQTWPLQMAQAKQWSGHFSDQQGWVLAGDAAHTIHPLAGLGLNLGLGDVIELAELLKARQQNAFWRPLHDPYFLRRYERSRKAALLPVWLTCDGLQRLFHHPNAGIQSLRNWGLQTFNQTHWLKQWVMHQAMH